MASTLAYLHAKISLNLTTIEEQIAQYEGLLKTLNTSLKASNIDWSDTKYYYTDDLVRKIYTDINANSQAVLKLHSSTVEELKENYRNLKYILPIPSQEDIAFRNQRETLERNLDTNLTRRREPRFLNSLSLPFGIFGTFMGLYNKRQIEHLRRELHSTQDGIKRIVEVIKFQDIQIKDIQNEINNLYSILQIHIKRDPGLLEARLSRLENQIKDRIQISVHLVQQAHHHRLSIDFLPQIQVQALFLKLQKLANLHGCTLLLEQPSDLFQIETSYFYDGHSVHTLLHVPMIPPDSLLRLFKLHSFPLPLADKKHYFLPKTGEDILAITAGSQRYSTQFSTTDLLGCHLVNKIYLCESKGVLNKNFNNTCLGALYQQNLPSVKRLCPLSIHQTDEIIRQLLGNWFAVFSPRQLTIPVECRNGTSRELMIPQGVSKFHLSEGCQAQFSNHLVTSDFSIREPGDFIEYQWRWDSIEEIIPQMSFQMISTKVNLFEKVGLYNPTLDDIQNFMLNESQRVPWWIHVIHFIGNSLICIVIIGIISYGIYKFVQFRRMKISSPIDPISINNQMYPEL